MSTTDLPTLNEQQVDAILTEALSVGYFELGPGGQQPEGPARLEAALDLINQCRLAHAAGNVSPGVTSLLFIAEVDQRPNSDPKGDSLATQETEQNDLTTHSDEALQKFEQALLNYDPQTEEVEENLRLVRAELERRGGSATPAQNGGAVVKEDARKDLEDRLTFSMMRNHQVDPSEVTSLSDEALRWIIDHPGGGNDSAPDPVSGTRQEVVLADDGERVETTRMVVDQEPESEPAPSIPAPEPETGAETSISPEREEMEAQMTGPLLKAYGKGRKDVLEIGDNELRFMIDHPDGRVTQAQLDAARALDAQGTAPAQAQPAEDEKPPPTIAEQNRAKKSGADVAFAPRPETPEEDKPADKPAPEIEEPPAAAEVPEPAQEDTEPDTPASEPAQTARKQTLLTDLPEDPAAEIIAKENWPIPPDVSDEDVPRLPFDLSKVSDDELRSHHARSHALHSRANYVVGLYESELRDLQKLRRGREVVVANDLPVKDGRTRITDSQRDAMIAADSEVVAFREQEHGVERILRQISLLRDNFSRDVSVCSRQWSFRYSEREGAGGLK